MSCGFHGPAGRFLALARVPLCLGLAASCALAAPNPWGDVNQDGAVTKADATLVQAYMDPISRASMSPAQQERIRRYGDVNGAINRSDVGNNVVDAHDAARSLRMMGGAADPGTAGTTHPQYGDVNGDGMVTMVDAVLVKRHMEARLTAGQKDPVTGALVRARAAARGVGDTSPTIPFVGFGDGKITQADVDVVLARATGAEANPPAYTDFWPLHLPTVDHPGVAPDLYEFADVNMMSGDLAGRTTYATWVTEEIRGYTVTQVLGTDGSMVGLFKGMDGSLYALYIQYPLAFSGHRIDFMEPMKILDARAARGNGEAWQGRTEADVKTAGVRPAVYTGTVLSGAGSQNAQASPSPWAGTVRVRIDVAFLSTPTNSFDMQQALFFDFAPHIGPVARGQAAMRGAAVPSNGRPYLELRRATVRGLEYVSALPN